MDYENLQLIGGSLKTLKLPKTTDVASPQTGALAVTDKALMLRADGDWKSVAILNEVALFPFTTFTFNGNGTGRDASTLAQFLARSEYAAQEWTKNTSFFVTSAGVQRFRIPLTGIYELVLEGASSTSKFFWQRTTVTVELFQNEVINILAGKYGPENSGAGGTFVWSQTRGLIAVAGGAGGCSSSSSYSPIVPSLLNDTSAPVMAAGVGSVDSHGQGGAGFSIAGSTDFSGVAALSAMNGGRGGLPKKANAADGTYGGYGGGGGYTNTGTTGFGSGGGGGYRGGNGGTGTIYTSKASAGSSHYSSLCLTGEITAPASGAHVGICKVTKL